MGPTSPAIDGANITHCRSFVLSITTSAMANALAIAKGGYYVVSSVDCDVQLGTSAGDKISAKLSSVASQPAAASPNKAMHCPALAIMPLDVPDAMFISGIAESSSGTVWVIGPLAKTANR